MPFGFARFDIGADTYHARRIFSPGSTTSRVSQKNTKTMNKNCVGLTRDGLLTASATVATLAIGMLAAQAAYPDPPGGWTYKYQGDQLIVGAENSGYTSLDGTWTHDNGSDGWDGSIIGGTLDNNGGFGVKNAPGGTILGTQNGANYLRLQDCGDPRDYGFTDQCSRKIYFGHNVGADIDQAKALTIMDTGVTLTFRARIPTLAKAGPPLDQLHRDGQQAAGVQPYPDAGDGYVTSDGGKGNFVIRQGGNGVDVPAGAIAFSFTTTNDTTGGDPNGVKAGFAGLTFNEFNGNVPSANVNFGQGTKTNVVAFDPTEWHELYIVIRKDPANIGTHEAFIFRDDGLKPIVFKMTAGTGSDMPDSFLAVGGSATPQNWALDVDWFGYKDEAVFPPGALLPPALFGFAPANKTLFYPAANNLSFAASALMPTNRLPAAGFKLILNGQDLSAQLSLTGTDTSASRTATYSGLQPNKQYVATYIVTDSGGLSTTNDLTFDTFVAATATIVEAEDYNHSGGQFTDNPPPGTYGSFQGLPGIDYYDSTPTTMGPFRTFDAVDMAVTVDVARSNFVSAGLLDYDISGVTPGEWWNYTRTLSSGSYNLWVRIASTATESIRVDRVTSGSSGTNQTRQFLGLINAPRTGSLGSYSYAQLTDLNGDPIPLPLGGATTLRLTAVNANGDMVLNYSLLQPASGASGPALVSVTPPSGATGQPGDAVVEAVIYDGAAAVSQASVKLKVDGADVPAVVSRSGTTTYVKYTPTALWSPGTTYNLSLLYNDGADHTVVWPFTTANYPVLTPAMKVTNASIPGLVWRVHQNGANQDNTAQKVLDAMSGALGLPNLADPNQQGPASDPGTPATPGNEPVVFKIPTFINVARGAGTSFGNFTPDEQMPGIPGTSTSTDGIAVQIDTFIQLPKGFISMGVASDDGFQTLAGYLNDTPLVLGSYDGGRSAAETLFQFAVQEAGVYAFRTLYYNGNGDASIEWYMVLPNGDRVLVNDTASGGPAGFQQGTIPRAQAMISAKASNGQVVITYSGGTLVSSDTVDGQYTAVAGASSPWPVNPADAARKFYKVKIQ
jgi:hypothetical protein